MQLTIADYLDAHDVLLARRERVEPRHGHGHCRVAPAAENQTLAYHTHATENRMNAARVAEIDGVILEAGDPIGLQQVLLNVMENALLVSRLGGEIAVSLAATAERAYVTGLGPGIAPRDRERIFGRF